MWSQLQSGFWPPGHCIWLTFASERRAWQLHVHRRRKPATPKPKHNASASHETATSRSLVRSPGRACACTIETFADVVPNYPMLPRVSKDLAGQDIDRHAARARGVAPGTGTDSRPLTEEELLLTSPIVYGFSFGDKQWCESPPLSSAFLIRGRR